MIKSLFKKFNNVKVDTAIKLPTQNIGGNEMDSCAVYMDIFKTGNDRPYIVYSAGIGDQINFELDLLKVLSDKGINVELYAIDPTPKSLEFLSKQKLPSNFHILPYALSGEDKELYFALPQTEGWISGSAADVKNDERKLDFPNKIKVDGKTISSIMKEFNHTKIDFLKMDIEGSEFDVLEDVLSKEIDITEMCVDHHEFMIKGGKRRMRNLLALLKDKYIIFSADNHNQKSFGCIRKDLSIF